MIRPELDAALRPRDAAPRPRAESRPSAPPAVTAEAERELMEAVREYKARSGRQFPTWTEVLEVLEGLGYRKA